MKRKDRRLIPEGTVMTSNPPASPGDQAPGAPAAAICKRPGCGNTLPAGDRVLPDTENSDVGGVHDPHEYRDESGSFVGEVPAAVGKVPGWLSGLATQRVRSRIKGEAWPQPGSRGPGTALAAQAGAAGPSSCPPVKTLISAHGPTPASAGRRAYRAAAAPRALSA